MKRKIITFLFFLFALIFCFPQQNKKSIDSLGKIVADKDAYAKLGKEGMLQLCTELYYQAKESGYEYQQMNALTQMSYLYFNSGEYDDCMRKTSECLALAQKNNHYIFWVAMLHIQGKVFTLLGVHDKARVAFNNGLKISDNYLKTETNNDNRDKMLLQRSQIYGGFAIIFEGTQGPRDSLLWYAKKAYYEAKKTQISNPKRNRFVGQSARIIASSYIVFFNDYDQGEKYLDEAEYFLKNELDQRFIVALLRFRGELEDKRKNYHKALEYYRKALPVAEKNNMQDELYVLYTDIARVNEKLKNYKEIADNFEKAAEIRGEIEAVKKNTLAGKDVVVLQKEHDDSVFLGDKKYLMIILLIILFLTGAFFFLKHQRKTVREKNSLADEPEKKIIEINYLLELVKNSDEAFYFKFQETFPDLFHKLLKIDPLLSNGDLEFCACLKLNLQTKQIASYKKLSVRSVEAKKYRLRKKLQIPQEANIYVWINNL